MALAVVAVSCFALLVLRPGLLRLLDRTRRAGKDGLEFGAAQEDARVPPAPSFGDVMNEPISATVAKREEWIKQSLAKFNLKSDAERQTILMRAFAVNAVAGEFTAVGHIIFGSQLDLLVELAGSPRPVPLVRAEVIYAEAKSKNPDIYKERDFDLWLAFLLSNNFVSRSDESIDITQQGKDFLKHLVETRTAHPRAA